MLSLKFGRHATRINKCWHYSYCVGRESKTIVMTAHQTIIKLKTKTFDHCSRWAICWCV